MEILRCERRIKSPCKQRDERLAGAFFDGGALCFCVEERDGGERPAQVEGVPREMFHDAQTDDVGVGGYVAEYPADVTQGEAPHRP